VPISRSRRSFLRAEYQYTHFDDFNGNKLNVNTVWGGAGMKF
jgi:opacity protein-like surface antigen